MQHFLARLQQLEREIRSELAEKKPLIMTRKDWKAFNEAEKCHICNKDLIRHNEKDERELWCPTGFYWGKAHRYKKEPIESNRPVSCYTSTMELLATDENEKRMKEWQARNYNRKRAYLKENPDESYCVHCNEPLLQEEFRDTVRDHCHITGKYRGAAYNACSLKLRTYP